MQYQIVIFEILLIHQASMAHFSEGELDPPTQLKLRDSLSVEIGVLPP
jgi:hypothetical protein